MSTTADIGLKPNAKILSFSQLGLSLLVIFLTRQLPNIEQA